jgi:hypothetical protein
MGKRWKGYTPQVAAQKHATEKQTKLQKAAPVPITVSINGADLKTLDNDALRKIATDAGFPDVNRIHSVSVFGGHQTPTVLTVNLGTANRHELLALLASAAEFVPKPAPIPVKEPAKQTASAL